MNPVPLSKVKLGQSIPRIQAIGILLDARESYIWIRKRKNLVGWTYSVTSYSEMVDSFKRLIACKGEPRKNIKFVNNVHIKCYINKDEMLIGSFNLTYPSVEDLCVRITDRNLIRHMLREFNHHWKSL